ncbi:DUF4843 domain-containing protein [Saccharicrinis fermentans]|uniref:DUF4843 domain-containing protein n=1 Tax=Saccharicrinis fermentans DSM 9555 = JCM 21142 TaxID=869213 RepID=W7XY53_9BACT|nr:DUF4843 domain-containing protein [Saccharicrinis fermentans]GAF03540.1 hypothetical protein JCM21142_52218 [Saccharicrinis fermentans DSM 9555 = JCM 21142]
MKKIKYLLLLFFAIMLIAACEKISTQMYEEERAMVNFSGTLTQHSFAKTGNESDTVNIPFYINGMDVDYVRTVAFEVVQDSTTAIEGDGADYTIVSSEVLPNEFTGYLKVKVNKPDDDVRVYFRVRDNDYFTVGVATETDHDLLLTNNLTPPIDWNLLTGRGLWKTKYYLGTYSTAYYQFIIDVTGETEIPYPWAVPGYNNNEKWSSAESAAFKTKITAELRKYNESIAPDVLLHDDGPAVGLPVIVGTYYQFD